MIKLINKGKNYIFYLLEGQVLIIILKKKVKYHRKLKVVINHKNKKEVAFFILSKILKNSN